MATPLRTWSDLRVQVMAGVQSLLQQRILFQISSVRISQHGTAKIGVYDVVSCMCETKFVRCAVLDWNLEPTTDPGIYEINTGYVANYLDELMEQLRMGISNWPKNAVKFQEELKLGRLPSIDVRRKLSCMYTNYADILSIHSWWLDQPEVYCEAHLCLP